MLLGDGTQLDDLLVQSLGTHGACSAKRLHALTNQTPGRYTIQGVYHELRKLQRIGVVVKVGQDYHLSLTWTAKVLQFAEQAATRFISQANSSLVLPPPGETNQWTFSDLFRADDLLVQIYEAALIETRCVNVFSWAPIPWYYFGQPKKVLEYYSFVRRTKRHLYYILKQDDFLTKKYLAAIPADLISYSFAPPPFEGRDSMIVTSFGHYIFTLGMDNQSCSRLLETFAKIRKDTDLTYAAIAPALKAPARVVLKAQHNEMRARKLQRQFSGFFGVPAV